MTKDFALVWKRICDNQGNKVNVNSIYAHNLNGSHKQQG